MGYVKSGVRYRVAHITADDLKMLKFTGYDAAIIGTTDSWLPATKMVYSGEKIVEMLVEVGMTEEEALEYLAFNMEGAYVGHATPIIVWKYCEEDDNLGD